MINPASGSSPGQLLRSAMLATAMYSSAAHIPAFAQDAVPQTGNDHAAHASNPAAYGQLLQQAEALIKSGNPGAAYSLLEPLEFAHAGEERFDYLLGIAALDSGNPDKATFALERVLLVNPDATAARLDIARAYYQLGDLPRAKTEFSAVLKQAPPPATRATIERYLDEISLREANPLTRYRAFLEGTLGHDSNVNNSTSQTQVYIDTLATSASLDPSNIQSADNYAALAAGAGVTRHVTPDWSAYAGADARKRNYASQSGFNALNLNAQAGVMYDKENHHLRLGASAGQYYLDSARNSNAGGGELEWRYALSPANQLRLFVQTAQYRFIDSAMQPNDYDLQAHGAGWLHTFPGGNSALFASAYQGQEKDVSTLINLPAAPGGGRTDGAKNFSGVRAGVQSAYGRATLFIQAGLQWGNYDRTNYWFQRKRQDRLFDLTLGANWNLDRQWSLRPQLNYALNESNIEIYGFNRMDVSLSIRRDFR